MSFAKVIRVGGAQGVPHWGWLALIAGLLALAVVIALCIGGLLLLAIIVATYRTRATRAIARDLFCTTCN